MNSLEIGSAKTGHGGDCRAGLWKEAGLSQGWVNPDKGNKEVAGSCENIPDSQRLLVPHLC